jgi:phage terminase large subunit-like protein
MCSRVRKTKDNKLPTQLMCSSNLGKRGNKWVRERFIEKIDEDIQDKSEIRFISSSYLDNIYLDRKDYEEYLMGLDRVTREQLMNGNWYATIKGQLFDESDFHLISNSDFLKISIIRIIRYWDLAATEVLNDDRLKGSDQDYTAGVLLAKDINGNIYIVDSYEFQLESRNLINEIPNTAARDKSDVQYIELDSSTGKNFGLLIIDELNRRGFTTGTGNSRENKVDRARRVSADIQKNGICLVGKDRTGFTKKWAMEFLEKITLYSNEAIGGGVAFTDDMKNILKS